MRVARNLAAAFAAFAISAPLCAQSLPTAKSLMERHDAAVGGRAAMDKHTSMHLVVAISVAAANMTGSAETWQQKPNLYFSKQTIAGGESTAGFDGKTAWAMDARQGGAQILDSTAAAAMKGQADFFGDYYDPSKVKSAETQEITDFDGKRCYKVKVVHKNDTEATIYFDSATGLRAGQSEVSKVMGQDIARTMIMSDYKDFGGVKMPTKRVQKLPMVDIVLEITNVEFDNVDKSVFALPDAVKALVKP
jgi:hypothetical protein